jgi:hypothetical protein
MYSCRVRPLVHHLPHEPQEIGIVFIAAAARVLSDDIDFGYDCCIARSQEAKDLALKMGDPGQRLTPAADGRNETVPRRRDVGRDGLRGYEVG